MTEITFEDIPTGEPLPPPPSTDAPATTDDKPRAKDAKKEDDKSTKRAIKDRDETSDDDAPTRGSSSAGLSQEMKELRRDEDRTLKEIIQGFGDSTAYKCRITRKWPQTTKDRATGKVHQTGGFLEWVEGQPIDEAWVQEHFGGGKYELLFRKRGPKGGWDYGGQVTIEVAGEPDLRALPGAEQPAAAAAPSGNGESPTMATKALDLMNEQLRRADERAEKATHGGGANDRLIELLQSQVLAAQAEAAALRQEMREAINRPPPQTSEDKFKDTLLGKLVDGDSARILALRTQYESEIRQTKEHALENEKRLYSQFDRDRSELKIGHERELGLVKSSNEAQLVAAKASFETQLAAAKSSFDTQKEIMAAENRRLDRENTELRSEVKELRAKKDKGLLEMATEVEKVKEVLGLDGDEKSGIGDKIADLLTNPDGIAAIGKIVRGDGPPAPAPAAAAPAAAPQQRRVITHKQDGKKYILEADGTLTGPLKPKQKQVGAEGVAGPPPIDPGTLAQMVALLENAYSNGTSPEMVAQSAKPHLSDQILMLIREVGGVDAFLTKVAKLPGSSPLLSTQAGRNWVRKVGKSLVGDDE